MKISESYVREILATHYPSKPIREVIDKGIWYKHISKVIFEDGESIYIKFGKENVEMEQYATWLLNQHEIFQPQIPFVGISNIDSFPEYAVYENTQGKPLSFYLSEQNQVELRKIYNVLGKYYKKFSSITGQFAGVWDVTPTKNKYGVHPVDGMYRLEIENGSCLALHQLGLITAKEYGDIKSIWRKFRSKIKELPVQLTHFSPFPWSIYLTEDSGSYQVSKITALGDILWWNEHATVAHVIYPPFFNIDSSLRNSFLAGYGRDLDDQILDFFVLFFRICAINGTYMEPKEYSHEEFKKQATEEIRVLIQKLL